MLCNICFLMLRGHDGRQWKGTYDLHFKHHNKVQELRKAATMNCGICRVIFDDLQSKLDPEQVAEDQDFCISANLAVLPDHRSQHLYRLDFKLKYDRVRCQRTFVLKETKREDPTFLTPVSHSTSSDEVFQLAMQWICKCKCAERPPNWYPTRLIDLSPLKDQNYLNTKLLISTGQLNRRKLDEIQVKLVESRDWFDKTPEGENVLYVTLSHCWGPPIENQLKLTSKNMKRLKTGIRLCDLPQTFRDAIEFASRLTQVGYIWIDSLCIKQDEDNKQDWLAESANMDLVYKESFLNISATAAESNSQGLFSPRRPELLLEDEITLNIDGIPGANSSTRDRFQLSPTDRPTKSLPTSLNPPFIVPWYRETRSFDILLLPIVWLRMALAILLLLGPYDGSLIHPKSKAQRSGDNTAQSVASEPSKDDTETAKVKTTIVNDNPKILERCTILDASFWERRVDLAPVNKRGWVLQERLIAPRVLHFCYDQIAWECSEFDAAEGRPRGIPNYQITSEGLVEESRLKGLDPETNGKALRQLRLKGLYDPDEHLVPEIYAFELWGRIVEVYSRTTLTNPGDKLIALSGIAKMMAGKIGTVHEPVTYIAGLWRKHLASQLLWKVEPVFQELDGSFKHLAKRPQEYRAPSFSWASLDTHEGNGITYGEVTDQNLLIEVEDVQTTLKSTENEHGIVTGGHIVLWGKLRKAKVYKRDKGRFSWRLDGRGELEAEEHTNVYLDCSVDTIFETEDIYCLPSALGPRPEREESAYLICLLLQLQSDLEEPTYKRIGLTKLSPWADKLARHNNKILETFQSDIAFPHQGYDRDTGRHRIFIV